MKASLGWPGILRLGCVQAGLGAIVVLVTSTMNRVMVVELALPAVVPAALVALHYAVQVLRPSVGHGSDRDGRRTPWIRGGMALLASGGVLAAVATGLMVRSPVAGVALAVPAFTLVGLGVATSGTALLALMAQRVAPQRRASAASALWIMMILGIVVTAGIGGRLLQPFSATRLLLVQTLVSLLAVLLTFVATAGVEGRPADRSGAAPAGRPVPFRQALAEVWSEPASRRFTLFVGLSMLAYSAQELLLEPFAGAVFHLSAGQTAQLTGLQHGGALIGMVLVASGGNLLGRIGRSPRVWVVGGCGASAAALILLAFAGLVGDARLVTVAVGALGLANGVFAVSAIGAMMQLAATGKTGQAGEGVRVGLWGAAQAVAFALGGLLGAGSSDLLRAVLPNVAMSYAVVLAGGALLFLLAARLAAHVFAAPTLPEKEFGLVGDVAPAWTPP